MVSHAKGMIVELNTELEAILKYNILKYNILKYNILNFKPFSYETWHCT